MKMNRLYTEDTKATQAIIEEASVNHGFTLTFAVGQYNGQRENSLILESTDFHLLIGIAARIVAEHEQEEVWCVDSNNVVWIASISGGIVRVVNTENNEQYTTRTAQQQHEHEHEYNRARARARRTEHENRARAREQSRAYAISVQQYNEQCRELWRD